MKAKVCKMVERKSGESQRLIVLAKTDLNKENNQGKGR